MISVHCRVEVSFLNETPRFGDPGGLSSSSSVKQGFSESTSMVSWNWKQETCLFKFLGTLCTGYCKHYCFSDMAE